MDYKQVKYEDLTDQVKYELGNILLAKGVVTIERPDFQSLITAKGDSFHYGIFFKDAEFDIDTGTYDFMSEFEEGVIQCDHGPEALEEFIEILEEYF